MSDVSPYFVIDEDSVQLGPWQYRTHGEAWQTLPDLIEDWDYNTDIQIRRSVTLDTEQALAASGLEEPTQLAWSVTWRARDSKLCPTAALVSSVAATSSLEARLDGQELGAIVDITTRIVLAEDRPATRLGVAYRAGSILFEDEVRLELMGSMARFPITIVDFASAGLDPDASVVLELPDDPGAPVLGGALLMINSRDSALVAAVSSAETRRSEGDVSLRSALAEEVFRRLIDYATDPGRTTVLEAADFDDESIGRSVILLAQRAERYEGIRGLRLLRQADPSRYTAAVIGEARRQGQGRSFS